MTKYKLLITVEIDLNTHSFRDIIKDESLVKGVQVYQMPEDPPIN